MDITNGNNLNHTMSSTDHRSVLNQLASNSYKTKKKNWSAWDAWLNAHPVKILQQSSFSCATMKGWEESAYKACYTLGDTNRQILLMMNLFLFVLHYDAAYSQWEGETDGLLMWSQKASPAYLC